MQEKIVGEEKLDLISIIIPIYNNEKFLEKCITSVVNQSYQSIEIILVNDGSTDKSASICKLYKESDKRIIYIEQENGGVSRARNSGLAISKGDYVCFVDSDDYIKSDMIEMMHIQIKRDKSQICALVDTTIKKNYIKKPYISSRRALQLLALLKYPSSMCANMYRKDIIADLRLNESIYYFEDFLFNFYAAMNSKQVSLLHGDYYEYYQNDESANHQRINAKRLSCLSIYEIVKNSIPEKSIDRRMQFFRMHCLLSIILAVAKCQNSEAFYYDAIRTSAQQMTLGVLLSPFVPLHYKMIHLFVLISPRLFIGFLRKYRYRVT